MDKKIKINGSVTDLLHNSPSERVSLDLQARRLSSNDYRSFWIAKSRTIFDNRGFSSKITEISEICVFIVLLLAVFSIEAHSFDGKIHPLLKKAPRSMVCKAWINFRNKPISDEFDASPTLERAQLRRIRRSKNVQVSPQRCDATDLPVSRRYIEKVLAIGGRLRATSRWLNAISIEASIDEIDQIARLDFVDSIEPVRSYNRYGPEGSVPQDDATGKDVGIRSRALREEKRSRCALGAPHPATSDASMRWHYGSSYKQLEQLNVDALHEKGYHGENMLVGLLDTGFDLSHEAVMDTDVMGERDFIYDDENTANQPQQDDADQDEHGTFVLSVIAGNAPEELIGVAFSASYLLGKTEKVSEKGMDFEKRVEEDWWIEGIEWMEAMGVDVVNSSLGYSDWYRFSELDGETAKITRAANLAVEKGVVVVIAAGNMGSSQSDELGLQGHINPPADGFDVLAVGAVDYQGKVASFSSRGPTYDGRIKPDFVAMGIDAIVVDAKTDDAYLQMNGTSMASPLVAGAAVLLLQAFPNATAKELVEALRKTASLADSPNNDYGYGIVNAQAAYNFLLAGQVSVEESLVLDSQWGQIKSEPTGFSLGQNYPNPFNPETFIPFTLGHDANVSLSIYDMQGRLVRQFKLGYLPTGVYDERGKTARWDGENQRGERAASGCYFYQIVATLGRRYDFTATRKMSVVK